MPLKKQTKKKQAGKDGKGATKPRIYRKRISARKPQPKKDTDKTQTKLPATMRHDTTNKRQDAPGGSPSKIDLRSNTEAHRVTKKKKSTERKPSSSERTIWRKRHTTEYGYRRTDGVP